MMENHAFMAGLSVSSEIVSGNHKALHAQSRIYDVINARLEEISFRKGMATSASALVFLATAGLVTAELSGQGNPASGVLSGQADGGPLSAVATTPLGSASIPSSAVPSHPPRRSHPTANRPAYTASVPGQGSGTGKVRTPAPAVSAIPPTGSPSHSGHWWHGGRDRDGWHHGDQGWNGWGPGGGDPWHGGRHW